MVCCVQDISCICSGKIGIFEHSTILDGLSASAPKREQHDKQIGVVDAPVAVDIHAP